MQARNSLRILAQDTAWSIFSTFALVIAGFGLNVIVGNLFGNSGLGVYALVTSIYLFVSSLSALGQPVALIKYAAEFIDEPEVGKQYFTASTIFVLVSGIITGVILLILDDELAALFNVPELADLLPILAISLPIFGFNKVIIAQLNGQRRMRLMAIAEILRYGLIILLTWYMAWFLNGDLAASIWPFLIAEIGLLLILWFGAKIGSGFSLMHFKRRLRELNWFGIQMTLARLVGELNGRLDVFLAGYFLTQGEVGVYSVAVMFAQGLSILPIALQKIARPVITDLHAKKQLATIETFTNQVTQLTMLSLILLVVPMIVFFQPIVAFMYPGQDEFLTAQVAFNILVAGFVFRSAALTVASIYGSVGRPDVELKIMPALPLVNCTVSLLLVNHFRMAGVAAGAASAAFVVFVLWVGLIRPIVRIRIDLKPLFALPLMGIVITLTIFFLKPYISQVLSTLVLVGGFALIVIRLRRFDVYFVRLLQRV